MMIRKSLSKIAPLSAMVLSLLVSGTAQASVEVEYLSLLQMFHRMSTKLSQTLQRGSREIAVGSEKSAVGPYDYNAHDPGTGDLIGPKSSQKAD